MQDMLSEIGSLFGVTVNYGQMPDSPDNIVMMNFSGGNSPRRSLGRAKPTIREPLIQLMVRNTTYIGCVNQINSCIDILNTVSGVYGGLTVTKLTQFGDVLYLGRDEKNRYLFTINFTIQIDNAKED